LLPLALATATEIASCPPDAVREIKRLMVAARLPGVRAARNREEAAFAELFGRTVRRIEGDAK
jgi:enoyl-CoA hydratase/carnithine racemase